MVCVIKLCAVELSKMGFQSIKCIYIIDIFTQMVNYITTCKNAAVDKL